jgi:hypothetical protein
MMNDRSLWFRAKPYLVDLEEMINFGFDLGSVWRYNYCKYPHFCDESQPQYIQPCLDFIDTASKERWQQVKYTNLRSLDEPWEIDFKYTKWNRCYHSLWKSLDSESILYIMILDGDGFLCLDTKENALVAGVQGAHPGVKAMDFESYTSGGQGPMINLFPINPEVLLDKAPETQLSMEEAKRHLGTIEVERVFLHFKRLIISFLCNCMELYEKSCSSDDEKLLNDDEKLLNDDEKLLNDDENYYQCVGIQEGVDSHTVSEQNSPLFIAMHSFFNNRQKPLSDSDFIRNAPKK